MLIFHKFIYKLDVIPIRILAVFFVEIAMLLPIFIWNFKELKIAKTVFKRSNHVLKAKYVREGKIDISIRKVLSSLESRKSTNWRETLVKDMLQSVQWIYTYKMYIYIYIWIILTTIIRLARLIKANWDNNIK